MDGEVIPITFLPKIRRVDAKAGVWVFFPVGSTNPGTIWLQVKHQHLQVF
jgi:hypothetical protein